MAVDYAAIKRPALSVSKYLLKNGMFGFDSISQVGSIEAGDVGLRILQPQLCEDIGSDPVCGGCGEGEEGKVWE